MTNIQEKADGDRHSLVCTFAQNSAGEHKLTCQNEISFQVPSANYQISECIWDPVPSIVPPDVLHRTLRGLAWRFLCQIQCSPGWHREGCPARCVTISLFLHRVYIHTWVPAKCHIDCIDECQTLHNKNVSVGWSLTGRLHLCSHDFWTRKLAILNIFYSCFNTVRIAAALNIQRVVREPYISW